jgi:hypothetical protein
VNNDAFEFFCQGHLAEAIAAYSASIATSPSPLLLSNRALARWRSGDYVGAIADYQAADQLDSPAARSDANPKRIASILWMMGHQEEALARWDDVLARAERYEFRYTDGSGGAHAGLLLWFGACYSHDAPVAERAIAFVRKRLKKRGRQLWPRPVAQFVIGELEEAELLRLARAEEPLAARRLCQAEFYAAVQARVRGDRAREASGFVAAVEAGEPVPLEIEFYLAQHELTAGSRPTRDDHVARIDIDPATGVLTSGSVRIGPATTKNSMLSAAAFRTGGYTNEAAGWFAADLHPQRDGELTFLVSLMFHGDHLHYVTIMNDDQRYGASWSDWSRVKEEERRSSHDAWLQQKLGDVKRSWPWGEVSSGFDDKGGFSRIVLRYRDLETCKPAGARTSWWRGILAR